jgi:arginyl-tRNA synthetase
MYKALYTKYIKMHKNIMVYTNKHIGKQEISLNVSKILKFCLFISATRLDQNADTADVLAVSAVVVNDLKQRRQRDYDFDWDRALQVKTTQ